MASPPTSNPARSIRFLDPGGAGIEAPVEWARAWIELGVPETPWVAPRLLVNGAPQTVLRRSLAGRERVLVDWDRAGAGYYRVALHHPEVHEERTVRVAPWKLSLAAFNAMLDELEVELPAAIALALRRGGALADVELRSLQPATLSEELERLRRAVRGTRGRPGLLQILPMIERRPYRALRETELWVRRHRVRRIGTAGLLRALTRPGNLRGDEPLPLHAPDRRVEPTFDVYENRLVGAFLDEVESRLRRLSAVLQERSGAAALADEAAELRLDLDKARKGARFLGEVSELATPPRRVTMVLLRRPGYRDALEAWLAFRRSIALRLRTPEIDAPLEQTPALYERWGTLVVTRALLETALALGFRVAQQGLVRRRRAGLWLDVLPAGRPILELEHLETSTRVSLAAQQSFGRSGDLQSVSFGQRPDVVIRIDAPARPPRILIYDPKYKLDSESQEKGLEDPTLRGQPRKVDIDKMHAYRDAIRTTDSTRVTHFAAILFPGQTVRFSRGLAAISAVPGDQPAALEELGATIRSALESADPALTIATNPAA